MLLPQSLPAAQLGSVIAFHCCSLHLFHLLGMVQFQASVISYLSWALPPFCALLRPLALHSLVGCILVVWVEQGSEMGGASLGILEIRTCELLPRWGARCQELSLTSAAARVAIRGSSRRVPVRLCAKAILHESRQFVWLSFFITGPDCEVLSRDRSHGYGGYPLSNPCPQIFI